MTKPLEKPDGPVVLSVDLIDGGKLYPAGTETCFTCETLPAHLKEYISDGSEPPPFDRRSIDFYSNPGPDPGVFFQQTGGGGQWRQARQAAGSLQEEAWAEEQVRAANKLSPEVEEALEAAHDKSSALAKAELEARHRLTDTVYEAAEQEAAAKEARQQLHVKRGGMMAKTQNARLKPGEKCFLRDGDEWVFAGLINSTGDPPPQPIIT